MIQKERLLNTFLDYVTIDSESTAEKAMAERIAADLREIGCRIYFDASREKTGCDTGNLYCTLPATAEGEPILFSAHMDTVVPGRGIKPIIKDGVIYSAGDTVLGGDDKSGVAAIVEALRTVAERGLPHPEIQAVFTVAEEVGLRGSAALEYDRITAKRAVVLDSSGDTGKIITQAPGQYKINAAVIGRRAHAGVAPEEGVSAIQVLAHAIAAMKLLRIDEETTANIGTVSAQYATNIVPERAEMQAEARSRSDDKLEAQVKHMADCLQSACDRFGARLALDLKRAYSAYAHAPDDPFVRTVADTCVRIGVTPQLAASGGGSDANNLNAHGIKALVLGTGMTKVHTTQEELSIRNLEDTARLALALMTV